MQKARGFQKNMLFCFIDYSKAFGCWITANWKILKETGVPDQLTCPLRNLYAGWEATVSSRHGTTDWFTVGKGVWQDYILSLCLFNVCAEYIMWSVWLDESQDGIKIAGRYINKLSCSDGNKFACNARDPGSIPTHSSILAWEILWTEEPGGLQSMGCKESNMIEVTDTLTFQICRWYHPNGRKWRGTKEPLDKGERGEWKGWLKLNIQKTKIMASSPITSWQNRRGKSGNSKTLFSWAPKSLQIVTVAMKFKDFCSLEGKLWQT